MKLRGTSRVAGGRVAHQIEGPREAPPLLLLPGQANSHRWWRDVRPLLVDRFLTITFDYRGTGDSAGVDASEWSTALFADDAADVLTALGIDRADVYGTSMGGRVAQELAINHPHRVGRLVLACTTPGGRIAVERSREVRLELARPDPSRRLRAIVDLFYTPAFVRAHGGHERVPTHLFGDRDITPEAAHAHLLVSARHDASGRLHRIHAPTLIIHGDQDRMAPVENATILGDRISRSRVEIVPEGRHGFFDEFAASVTEMVAGHLGQPGE